jgi:tRNA A37 threonylcarbamoyladenosine synthetase subunit TsaC/SUA5/YrdC
MLSKLKVYTWERGGELFYRAVRTDTGAGVGGDASSPEIRNTVVSMLARAAGLPLTVMVKASPGKVARA